MKDSMRLFWGLAGRVWVGSVFCFAGYFKLMEPVENFRGVLAQYEILPYAGVSWIASGLPWLELIFGVFLILGFAPRPSSLVLALLSLSFLVVLGISLALHKSVPLSCGCFGEGGIHLTVPQIFFLDLVDFLICLKIFPFKEYPWSLESLMRQSSED